MQAKNLSEVRPGAEMSSQQEDDYRSGDSGGGQKVIPTLNKGAVCPKTKTDNIILNKELDL